MRQSDDKVDFTEQIIDYEEINQKIGLNNIAVKQKPLLTISSWCHNHIQNLHDIYRNKEWWALCKIENKWNWHFVMTDMIHPEQKAVGTEVEITENWLDWAVKYLTEQGENLSEWNCILHSHHHMGCFWSLTDDNARKSMNDWRTLSWNVVTAYDWQVKWYKGCLNYYKPYPIEIDCDIEYEIDDLYWQAKEWWDYIQNRTKEIYNEMVMSDEKLGELQKKYDYSWLLTYLWIDISEELLTNARLIEMKMPSSENFAERMKEILKEAQEKAQEEVGAPVDSELTQRIKWNKDLIDDLEDAFVWQVKNLDDYQSGSVQINNTPVVNWNNKEEQEEIDDEVDYFMYNAENFTEAELRDMLDLDFNLKLQLNEDELWCVYDLCYGERIYIWDLIEDGAIYDYREEFMSK